MLLPAGKTVLRVLLRGKGAQALEFEVTNRHLGEGAVVADEEMVQLLGEALSVLGGGSIYSLAVGRLSRGITSKDKIPWATQLVLKKLAGGATKASVVKEVLEAAVVPWAVPNKRPELVRDMLSRIIV